MASQITYVPVSGGSTITLNFGTLNTQLQNFRAHRAPNAAQAISAGGKQYSVIHDQFFIADVKYAPVYFGTFAGSSLTTAQSTEWAEFHAWAAYAQRGGEFTFAVDENNTYATLMNGAQSQGDTNLQVDSEAGAAAGEWIYIENVDDPTQWEKHRVSSTSAGAIAISTTTGVLFSYPDNSIVRYHEYFPACVLYPLDQPVFLERPGGQGAYYFDIEFTFRTVR